VLLVLVLPLDVVELVPVPVEPLDEPVTPPLVVETGLPPGGSG
jgi:hypothetical protein